MRAALKTHFIIFAYVELYYVRYAKPVLKMSTYKVNLPIFRDVSGKKEVCLLLETTRQRTLLTANSLLHN